MDIERIKSTPLGRAWLSRFVERIWEHVLTANGRNRLRFDVHSDVHGDSERLRLLEPFDREDRQTNRRFAVAGLIKEASHEPRLTPLGVEVYLYGRRNARERARRIS